MAGRQFRGLEGVQFDSVVRYKILEEIGRGGMGVVYLAERASEGVREKVVLKTIRDLAPQAEEDLKREASLATRLRHQNIVKTYGLESIHVSQLPPELQEALQTSMGKTSRRVLLEKRTARGLKRRRAFGGESSVESPAVVTLGPQSAPTDEEKIFCIVMQYIDGIDLLDLHLEHLRRGMLLPVKLGAYIISRIARALEVAHNNLIHRDVSCENVLLDSQGVPLLSDFGTAVVAGHGEGRRVGKLSYMAPEVIRNDPIDDRIDIYSLGIMAVVLGSGMFVQAPPRKGTMEVKFLKVLERIEKGFPALKDICPDVPDVYSDIVERMISADPDLRPPKAGVLASEIEKHFLYAEGFGPTYQSIASYISIFESNFKRYDDEQLAMLSFLRDENGDLKLRRPLSGDRYTERGRNMISHRQGSFLQAALEESEKQPTIPTAIVEGNQLLKIRFADNCLETIRLQSGDRLDLGRNRAQVDIQLIDKLASRKHAQIEVTLTKAKIRDWESGNGTYVNGQKITEAELQEGSHVRIGNTSMYYLREPQILPPSNPVDNIPELGPPRDLLNKSAFALRFFCDKRVRLQGFFEDMAQRAGIPEQKSFMFANAVLETCGLVSEAQRSVTLHVFQERARFRFHFFTPEGSKFLEKSLMMFKAIIAGAEVEMGTRSMGVTLVRHVFDRVDFYVHDRVLVLSKFY